MRSRRLLWVLIPALLCLPACDQRETTPPTSPGMNGSLPGTWSGDGVTVVVGPDLVWQGTADATWACPDRTCSYRISVTGVVRPTAPYSIDASRRDSYGNLGRITGTWDPGISTLTGTAIATTTYGSTSWSFIARKTG